LTNPFAVTTGAAPDRGVFGDHARRVRSAFLFRVVDFDRPFSGRLTYSSWWWRQKIEISGYRVWFRVSWMRIHRRAEFTLPPAVAPSEPQGIVEIDFTRTLRIRRFRLWIAGEIVYDEIA